MNKSIKVKAFGKINLFLDIVGRLDNGYHQLSTIMQSVSCHDIITVQFSNDFGIKISCNSGSVPTDNSNLVWKATELFLQEESIDYSGGFNINIEKHIPQMAGMGGGSADCAGMLVALNALFDTRLTTDKLCEIGANLGADVPFCIVGGTCLCEGIGEVITPLKISTEYHILLVKPTFAISTPMAYNKYDSTKIHVHPDISAIKKALQNDDSQAVADCLFNCFEKASEINEIFTIKQELITAGAMGAIMTGSGSVVYGLYSSELEAQKALGIISQKYSCEICRPITYATQIIDMR